MAFGVTRPKRGYVEGFQMTDHERDPVASNRVKIVVVVVPRRRLEVLCQAPVAFEANTTNIEEFLSPFCQLLLQCLGIALPIFERVDGQFWDPGWVIPSKRNLLADVDDPLGFPHEVA